MSEIAHEPPIHTLQDLADIKARLLTVSLKAMALEQDDERIFEGFSDAWEDMPYFHAAFDNDLYTLRQNSIHRMLKSCGGLKLIGVTLEQTDFATRIITPRDILSPSLGFTILAPIA